jgi:foldase protein PrsA
LRKPIAIAGVFFVFVVAATVMAAIAGGCGSQPMAVVNGVKISRADFLNRLEQTQGKEILGDLILRALVDDSFAKAGLTLSDEELDEQLQEVKSSAPDEAAWQQLLAAQGITETELRDIFAFQMKVRKLGTKDVEVSEERLKKFFEENRDMFNEPESVEIAEIVLPGKQEADKLAQQLASKPDSFGDLARQHSLSPITREHGGRRGRVPVDRITPTQVRAAVQKLKPGQVSEPINAEGNWYLIKVENHFPAKQPTFEEISDTVETAYTMQHAKSEQDLMAELRKGAQVTILDPKYQSLSEFFRPDPGTSLPTFGSGDGQPEQPEPPAPTPEAGAPAGGGQ